MTAKTYLGSTALEYQYGWIIKQVRSKGVYTRCMGYIAKLPNEEFFLIAKHYRDIKKMIKSAYMENRENGFKRG